MENLEFIRSFWVELLPSLGIYGSIGYDILTIVSIIIMLRLIYMVPLYFMGSVRKI